MTRLEQALHWWNTHEGDPIPQRHFDVLNAEGALDYNDFEGWWELNDAGHKLMAVGAPKP